MIDQEKREFGKWWLWVLLLVMITAIAGFALRGAGVFGGRIIFENSYQKHSADNARRSALEAELVGINTRLQSGDLTETQRSDLKAQRAAVQFQLNKVD